MPVTRTWEAEFMNSSSAFTDRPYSLTSLIRWECVRSEGRWMDGWICRLSSWQKGKTANKALFLLTINQVGSGTWLLFLQKQQPFAFNLLHRSYQLNIIRYLQAPQPLILESITTACFSKEPRICAWSIAELQILKRGSPAFLLLPASVMFISSFLLLFLRKAHRRRSGLFMLPPSQD
jgi:hypothetical protein